MARHDVTHQAVTSHNLHMYLEQEELDSW